MPQAKKSTRSSSARPSSSRSSSTRAASSRSSSSNRQSARGGTFKEPAALKRLTKSLDTAHEALAELRKDVGRDTPQATRDLQKQLRTSVSGSRRDTGKLVKALQRDFDRAQSQVKQRAGSAAARTSTASKSRGARAGTGRTTRKAA